MHKSEADSSSQANEYWQRLLHKYSTALFIINHLFGGSFAAAVPSYIALTPRQQVAEQPQLEQPQGDITTIFLPIIQSAPFDEEADSAVAENIWTAPYCAGQYPERTGYTLNDQEQQLEALLLNDPDQQHPELHFSIALSEAARRRALDMASRDYFGHTNPDGYGPNCIVLQHFFALPDSYDSSRTGNNIETIGAGFADIDAAWEAFMASEGHRTHLLGLNDFYNEQKYYGIGYVDAPDSTYGSYIVILISDSE